MEVDRSRQLTTRALGFQLLVVCACLLVGAVATARSDATLGALGPRAILQGLASFSPEAWLSLGVLLLILTPTVRVVGTLLTFSLQGRGKSVLAAIVLLGFLLGALILAPSQPTTKASADGDAAGEAALTSSTQEGQ